MSGLENLLSIAFAFFAVTVSPGPANIAVATVSMSFGRRNGLFFGAGLSVGLAFWGLVAATGMGAVLQGSANLLFALKVLGGIYLLWLAIQSGRAALTAAPNVRQLKGNGRLFSRGVLLNLSNPKAVVAWMAALSMGLDVGDSTGQVITVTLVCIVLGFLNYFGYAMAFSLPGFMTGYRRLRRWVDGIAAGLFAVAGFGLLRSAFSR